MGLNVNGLFMHQKQSIRRHARRFAGTLSKKEAINSYLIVSNPHFPELRMRFVVPATIKLDI